MGQSDIAGEGLASLAGCRVYECMQGDSINYPVANEKITKTISSAHRMKPGRFSRFVRGEGLEVALL